MVDREDILDRLGRLARDHVAVGGAGADAVTELRIASAVARDRDREGARRKMMLLPLVAAAVLGAALLVLWPRGAITYRVEGAAPQETGYVRAAPDARAVARFSEGSTATAAAGASFRVAETTEQGARLILEAGRLDMDVAPRARNRWSIEAGPFALMVTGTRFEVAWDAGREELDVLLREGTLTVRGPAPNQDTPLSAGQRLTARPRSGELRVGPIEAPVSAEPTGDAPTAQPDGASAPDTTSAPADGASTAGKPAKVPWAKRVAAGDFAGVLAEAEAQGLDGVLGSAGVADLTALGDAARYAGRADVARRALDATRARFAGSAQARTAAFLLGRLADDGGSSSAAIRWYDTYLAESPGGTFAAEALGRKMVALQHGSGASAARAVADDYLRRFPQGAHAARARQILDKQ